ncbi:MAG: 2-oxoglutarate dehydrogenase complex dihydrolipoyllysine-residue succinyltransferase [Bacteroidales bacterium]|nr:2-oxoglutarate dehydrogenase complex dihydrolipoyllysine-residue succinyltransferase [Bacteroidales bacterium]
MIIEIRIPSPGESISEVELARWLVEDNSWVDKDQEVAEVESEKATLPLIAAASGIIKIAIQAGTTIKINEIACTIDTSGAKPEVKSKVDTIPPKKEEIPVKVKVEDKPKQIDEKKDIDNKDLKVKITPLAEKMMKDENLSIDDILNGLKKISTHEVELVKHQNLFSQPHISGERVEERVKMSQLRKKLSERLVSVKNQTAMLTTFNEVDMSRVMEIRKTYQQAFQEKYGVKLGLMSFFTKAVVEALKQHPLVNSFLDKDEIVTPNYFDIGIAVQTPKGLMVPVIKNAERLTFGEIEKGIAALAEKGRSGRIGIEDLTGGTFTITNGGIFGSMLSTPILNPPQSGILGMHNIVDRPVAINSKVEIRPIMYVAFSYDHRIIDGKDSVGFLLKVKQMIEKPESMLFEGNNMDKRLIGI